MPSLADGEGRGFPRDEARQETGGTRGARRGKHLRRALDVSLAAAGLVALAPVMSMVAVAIRLETRGPVFFSQLRLGEGGRPFRIYKFRKFRDDETAADDETAIAGDVTVARDPRLTRVGRILERTKLDEVPQLWNVLRSDMAVVGPRPESLALAECFTEAWRPVLAHKPGIFGPNQFYFRNESALYPEDRDPREFYCEVLFPAKARIDLDYFARRTLSSDILWMMRGIFAVFGRPDRSAEALVTTLRRPRQSLPAAATAERAPHNREEGPAPSCG